MASNKYKYPYRLKTQDQMKKDINNVLGQLKSHGRAICPNNKVPRVMSRFMHEDSEMGRILFTRSKHKSVVVLPPGYKLIENKHKRIKIIYENNNGSL